MYNVITIARQFGSGGRELGRRLAEKLGFAYYDDEIIAEISKRTSLSEEYVQQIVEHRPVTLMPITIGHSFYPVQHPLMEQSQNIYQEQAQIINELSEKSPCVIVGCCADYILRQKKLLRLFVFADMQSKIERCRLKGPEEENLTDKQLRRQIQKVEKNRAKYYEFYTGRTWGDKLNYDLLVNTTNTDIRLIVDVICRMFDKNEYGETEE
ncbi:MAG: cytidylate kinase-like family protein [Clostridia bacterium]|nr:cytidylate kinase-like family protein [Clostridia bacterium]MBQ2110718.1 cytidylate kinase-like family protein [Clostridia bacterium]MBQ2191317.1 cytidylate kinase-like family protein [Clostridia bacterium]MBQ3939372.1 cytidylate kinase-like family protein [Clostridia bacterium]MBQ5488958.1 cytidylate kinase-like family protein [Clostridia bacterium]